MAVISSFPGHTNFDELNTLGEYFRGEVSDMHPPMQMLLSANIVQIGLKIGLMPIFSIFIILVSQLVIYWWSIRKIANIIKSDYLRIVFLAILSISPIALVYSAHIGKDSQMAISLLFACILIYQANIRKNRWLLTIALAPIFYAYTIRANGPVAAIPIIVYSNRG